MPRRIRGGMIDYEDDELNVFELLQSVEPEECDGSPTDDTMNTPDTAAAVDTSCTFVGMLPGAPSDQTGLLDAHEGLARCFLVDELEGKIRFVREFCKKHGCPRDLISSNRPCLVRAAEAPGLMHQWWVIESLVMRNVDRYPSGVLQQWMEDVDTHLECNGLNTSRSALVSLNLHYLTESEVLTFKLFLPILSNYRLIMEHSLIQCHLVLKSEDTLRSPAHIVSHSMGV